MWKRSAPVLAAASALLWAVLLVNAAISYANGWSHQALDVALALMPLAGLGVSLFSFRAAFRAPALAIGMALLTILAGAAYARAVQTGAIDVSGLPRGLTVPAQPRGR